MLMIGECVFGVSSMFLKFQKFRVCVPYNDRTAVQHNAREKERRCNNVLFSNEFFFPHPLKNVSVLIVSKTI